MLFLQPVNLPNPVYRDIASSLVILRRNPVSSCSTPQYHPHLQLTPFSQYVDEPFLKSSLTAEGSTFFPCLTSHQHPHFLVILIIPMHTIVPIARFVSSCAFSSFARCVSIEDNSPQTARTGNGYRSIEKSHICQFKRTTY
ncbi:uncharacterized protein Bfra_000455 [Botrytis fragariae]|uniref:Uncharacterized protein n=1 Tax=Botrytis fragariae TaxID=1964551 RepID=A0A8H6B2Q3_9HELO|nr:uncharacterized protein Bfra_000455 [Botrytis fragariae]KAF5878289.1 hypothetical protein Bfra_000455 [Botrytis fragariae]